MGWLEKRGLYRKRREAAAPGLQDDSELMQGGEDKFRFLFNNIPSGVVLYLPINDGQDFIIVDFNTTAEKIENVDRRDVIGKSIVDVFPGVKDFGLFDVLQRVWKTGKDGFLPSAIYRDEKRTGWRDYYVFRRGKLSSFIMTLRNKNERNLPFEWGSKDFGQSRTTHTTGKAG